MLLLFNDMEETPMTILDKTSQYGLRVKVQQISPAEFLVSMFDAATDELVRSTKAFSERTAMFHAERFLS